MLREMPIWPATSTYTQSLASKPADSTGTSQRASIGRLDVSPMRPEQILLFGEIAQGWIIKNPINLTIEKEGTLFIVSDKVFWIYGDGDTKSDAIDDYIFSLIDYFQLIESSTDNNRLNQQQLNHLRLYLRHATV
jgi:hypothetical protein